MNPSTFTWDKILKNVMGVKQYFFWVSKMASLTECAGSASLQTVNTHIFTGLFLFYVTGIRSRHGLISFCPLRSLFFLFLVGGGRRWLQIWVTLYISDRLNGFESLRPLLFLTLSIITVRPHTITNNTHLYTKMEHTF